ncbi:hypothetical protein D3C73_173220 [compost metagenome]
MRAKPLALAIARMYTDESKYFVSTAPVKSLWNPKEPPTIMESQTDIRYVVRDILVGDVAVALAPEIILKDGDVVRRFDTPGYSHVFTVTTDFATAKVSSTLKSWEHSTNEEVYIQGHWQISRIVNTTRLNRSKRHVRPF